MDGLSAAGSGLVSDQRLQQVIMNNISNLSTPGFKNSSGQLTAFPEQLLLRYQYGSNGAGAVPLGTVNPGALFQEATPNFTQGLIQHTGQPLDLAIEDPLNPGVSVYALAAKAGAPAKTAAPAMVSTLSLVVGRGGVVETAQGAPVLPVSAAGAPIADARIVVNPQYKGAALYGEGGSPVVDAKGNPSYLIVGPNGKPIPLQQGSPGVYFPVVSSQTGGVHSFFAVANVDAQGRQSVALTRDGQLHVGANGFLYDAVSQRLLGVNARGAPILNSAVKLNPLYHGSSYFGPNGAPLRDAAGQLSYTLVQANGAPLPTASFHTVAVAVSTLQPLGGTTFLPTAQTAFVKSGAAIQTGALESSNANSSQNMIGMLSVYRNYQANQIMAQTIDSTLKLAVTQVGVVTGL
ncbi:MAG: flagellar basal body rod C-terminal domain-containing protein [Bacilli bacterium]